MASTYAQVRKQWQKTDIQSALTALWRSERFEEPDAVAEALRIYELAIRVEGWDQLKGWANAALTNGAILNAQLVELAMRALEQRDRAFLERITKHLLDRSAPSYFRFWYTLFSTRHAHAGERVFRAQLHTLSDFRIVKYRRWLKRILRKLRFRCTSDRERAIGAIVFGMYDKYDANAYPSDVFAAYLACHDAARTRKQTKTGKPVSQAAHMKAFSAAAAKLGIWTATEGIRTSAKLPRSRAYLVAMAPKMTDRELIRALRILDANLKTADHKRASEPVVALAEHVHERLSRMDVTLEEWSKIYPYLNSPVLLRVFEQLIGAQVESGVERLAPLEHYAFIPIAPVPLAGRAFRAALLVSYLLYRRNREATAFVVDNEHVQAVDHPPALWPYGYGVRPNVWRWQASPDHPARVLFNLVRDLFPQAANRRQSTALGMQPYVDALRSHLHARATVDNHASPWDVPVLFFTEPPVQDERKALVAHLQMFSSAILVCFDRPWREPLACDHALHLSVGPQVDASCDVLLEQRDTLDRQRLAFLARQPAVNRELRRLRLGHAPIVHRVALGPHHTSGNPPSPSGSRPSSAPPRPEISGSGTCEVVLTSNGKARIQVIKVLRELTGRTLPECKQWTERPPTVVGRGLTPAAANRFVHALTAAGGTARVTTSSR